MFFWRYNTDGSVDTTFDIDGYVFSIISFHAGVTDFAIARYNNMITSTKKVAVKKIQFSLFPNPTSKYLNISLNNDDYFNFEIVNAVGEMVMKGKNTQQIDVSNLKEGPYF
ncbi:MAG: T9SS type A sorting domain-containing protein [Saprospiraceae bacterium]|nr:T9SS type A sorting domain-containing protein [Candidatus Defluviibacterium haderslevense]